MKKYFGFLFIALFMMQCQSQSTYEFTTEKSAEILKTLSSDDMRGRQAFTPDIEKTESFIASHFDEANLDFINGESDFLQEFEILAISIKSADIEITGKKVATEDFFAVLNSDNIEWATTNNISTEEIKKGEDFRARFNELRESASPAFVFVDESHESMFRRYQPFYSRASRIFPEEQPSNVIFVLSSAASNSKFSAYITKNVESHTLANVAGMIEGNRKDEYVLFSAHHDHIGIRNTTEADADSIANGANDDASGVTAVIELAKYFKSLGKPERTLLFVTFTAEEAGGYGSKYFSKQLAPKEIVAMFNIEMIGKPAVEGPNTAWITGFEKSTFGELLQKSAEGTIFEFYPDPYPNQNLFYRSDNATLARLGVPAHTISTTPIDVDPDYHQVSDEFETINVDHLTNTIKAISKGAIGIVSGLDTPTRVDASQLN